ncbi:MAG: ImmA/IrrE family metallo-endopeptidase [Solirubrobacteraceae bacterium]
MPSSVSADPQIEVAVDAARTLRREQGWDPEDPLPCAVRMAEDHLGLDVVVTRLPQPVSGAYLPRPRRGLILVNGTHAVVRQRFTVAHEVGHHVLGHGAAPRLLSRAAAETIPQPGEALATPEGESPSAVPVVASVGPAAHGSTRTEHDDRRAAGAATHGVAPTPADRGAVQEAQANAFAAELLAPATAVRSFVRRYAAAGPDGAPSIDFDLVVRLSCAYGISALSTLTRLGTVGLLTDDVARGALRARVDAGEHVPRYKDQGLIALEDELQEIERLGVLPRVPEGTDGRLLEALLDPTVIIPDGRTAAGIAKLRQMLGFAPAVP